MGVDPIAQWMALLDAVELLLLHASPHDPHAMDRVGKALDALEHYEHTLSPDQRRLARETAWRRDNPDPLPVDRTRWERCGCRSCRINRFVGRFKPSSPTPQLKQQPIQGDLFHGYVPGNHR